MDFDAGPPEVIAFPGDVTADGVHDVIEIVMDTRFDYLFGDADADTIEFDFEYTTRDGEILQISGTLEPVSDEEHDFRWSDDGDSGTTGTVKWFNSTKGYGFIQPESGDVDFYTLALAGDLL